MTEQLNELEKWIALRFWCAGGGDLIGDADTFGALVQEFDDREHKTIPPDPNLARITKIECEADKWKMIAENQNDAITSLLEQRTELEAELKRLNGLLNEVDDADYHLSSNTFFRDEVRSILPRRTAERKEHGDGA